MEYLFNKEIKEQVAEKKVASPVKETNPIVEITYYTDPLCCWSWAFEPQWRRLRYEFGGLIDWRYVMGGMISNWQTYDDPMNSVNRPVQMGPIWMEARNLSGMPMKDNIWIRDYPWSSYPACIAIKAAELQSAEAGERFLRNVRESVMVEGRNIAKTAVLLDIAISFAEEYPDLLDLEKFKNDLDHRGPEAFRQDLRQSRYLNVGRFPTLTINQPGHSGVMIIGYRPYEVLLQGLKQVVPDIQPVQKIEMTDYKKFWGYVTDRELSEVS